MEIEKNPSSRALNYDQVSLTQIYNSLSTKIQKNKTETSRNDPKCLSCLPCLSLMIYFCKSLEF